MILYTKRTTGDVSCYAKIEVKKRN